MKIISLLSSLLVSIVFIIVYECEAINNVIKSFDDNYFTTYGYDHLLRLNQGQEVQLTMDTTSGTGFISKKGYGSGYFEMKIKTPQSQSPAIVTTFYVNIFFHFSTLYCAHSELDFEFLTTQGPPFNLQTNVYSNDDGGREQMIHLWFDPSQDFHSYGILWNQHQIVFFVDNTPIRVYKNWTSSGVNYPGNEMFVTGSIWEGVWASNGTGADWAKAPFQAHYEEFEINGCEYGTADCSTQSDQFWWNKSDKWVLNPKQESDYENVKAKYLYYDYCQDKRSAYKECQLN
ncbi:xyloglucan endotransglucosylase/hydrolase protein 2-like [Humulus lupulus]|uniref:xyloglucan endotransglucosylase/hydrolase protein 2-like n=1 Tax=Humulus lupulus TaxID=3486 RepID=UPI002B411337|nr:xyloglucan endotransglucosylase/hydrolase protein 2-like [Humulus lupulus]